ncbi:DUF2790 domain-containing protein [Pseudomonas putida]|uniref:DUF2790 domain-containing protein n=1 Tax=Pseudomonas putida TaxID=303 RepID=A0A4D6X8V6_PSEPU|nr:DUF2790 domain-containing protein [Pseudomonas putida]QCI12339.1 DUF2790 domain-containing protein [Pseudomonas putida]
MKRSIAFLALSATLSSFAALAAEPASQAVETSNYQYGMPVDVAKVVSITPDSNAADCEVGTTHMVYVDHQGETHEIAYKEMGNCSRL